MIDDFRPNTLDVEGWEHAEGLDGLYRFATPLEVRRFDWPERTLVLASPFDPVEDGDDERAWVSIPTWSDDRKQWLFNVDDRVAFHRRELSKVQTLALGHFVEHRQASDGSSQLHIQRPTFEVFGAESPVDGFRMELLTVSSGGFLLHAMEKGGAVVASSPHTHKQLDIQAPPGFHVSIVSPGGGGVTRNPLIPYDCENGECDDPYDPLDECNDEVDNDGDGHRDLCDWNCLPHGDFGADKFPDAASRIEHGKSYALMGGGSICTDLGETWTVEFADMALKASELLNDVRPEVNDPVHFRVFSCWVFESYDAFMLCQHGPFEVIGEDVIYSDPVCPPGMDDYPYGPTDTDLLNPGDQANLLFEEATERAWLDLELNTHALGPAGEPVNGIAFITSNAVQTCSATPWPICSPAAGLAYESPDADIDVSGGAVVTNENPYDWHTLAHEVGHTLGLSHDTAPEGFMNDLPSGGILPILGITQDNVNVDNNENWEEAFMTKGLRPRSSGWSHTGCSGFDECAPLGKPGWSCNGLWCVLD